MNYKNGHAQDAMLVAGLRRREATAVEALVRDYSDRLYRLAVHITGNDRDAEEVVQDAFSNATRRIDTFREKSAFGTWLYRITTNAAYQTLRRRRHARQEVSWDDLGPSVDEQGHHLEPVADWSDRVQDPGVQTELRTVLTTAIKQLPMDYRLAFLLHDLQGLSNPETAETLRVSLPAVKSRVHRSRLFLRERLTEYLDDFGPAPDRLV